LADREDPQDQPKPNPLPSLAGVAPEDADPRLVSKARAEPRAIDELQAQRLAREDRQLDLELKRVALALEEARCRNGNADAEIKEQGAAKLKAEALEASHRAAWEPRRQAQSLTAGWVRIVLMATVTLFAMALLLIGYLIDPRAYAPATLAGLGIYPFRPWEFIFPANRIGPTEPEEPGG